MTHWPRVMPVRTSGMHRNSASPALDSLAAGRVADQPRVFPLGYLLCQSEMGVPATVQHLL